MNTYSNHIGPMDALPKGTAVRWRDKRGIVVKSAIVPASNGGMIALNTIKLTHKLRKLGAKRTFWVRLMPSITKSINYTGIYIIQ